MTTPTKGRPRLSERIAGPFNDSHAPYWTLNEDQRGELAKLGTLIETALKLNKGGVWASGWWEQKPSGAHFHHGPDVLIKPEDWTAFADACNAYRRFLDPNPRYTVAAKDHQGSPYWVIQDWEAGCKIAKCDSLEAAQHICRLLVADAQEGSAE